MLTMHFDAYEIEFRKKKKKNETTNAIGRALRTFIGDKGN